MSTMTKRRYLSAFILLSLFAAGGVTLWRVRAKVPRRDSVVTVGRTLPPIVVNDGLGRRVDLRTVAEGRRKLIVFYSPTCDVCKKELPELNPFPDGLALVMVKEGDAPNDDPFGVSGHTGDHLADRDGVFKRAFLMPSLPTMLFVDEHGVVRDGLIGAHPPAVTRSKLAQFAQGKA